MAQGDVTVGIAVGHHLALLGDLEVAAERVWGAREDGPAHGAATASDGPAPPVEERQPDAMPRGGVGQLGLGAVEQPGGREGARFLRRVGVAEHDLLVIAASADVRR